MTPTLHIQLLGRFRLSTDDAPVTTLDSPRLQALLAYLLLQRDAPHARAHLAFQLWPDTSEAQAHANLRTLLHRLRQTLPDTDRLLHIDAQTVQWRGDAPATLDVAEFERALARAAAAEQIGGQDAARAAFSEAVEQYGGDLLPALYDDWVLLERERLRQVFLAGLEKLVVLLEQANEYAAAIGYAQRLLRHDPLHEATYQQLMRLHALSGDRASAVRVYRTCATVLERELGVEPSPATHAAYERLRQMEPQPAPPASRPTSLAAGGRRHNLLIALTSFIGRAHERAEVRRLLARTRLLTLTGVGGCGKTRLALAVANELVADYPDGVLLVELGALADPTLVPQAVAAVLGVREAPQRPLMATLIDALQAKNLLLVLDNCEHLIDACAHLAQMLLGACPQLRILATSREALSVAGETTWLVPSLSLPRPERLPPLVELMQSEAVELFVERAAAALPTFTLTPENASDAVQVCRRLDGIPLAIELAAARVKVLSVAQIAARLDACFRLLTGGGRTAVPRHQSLRATIDWSYDLLSEPERALFRRLAVFAGGWTLEAAEVVCAGEAVASDDVLDLLAHLVDKSLVVVEPRASGAARYRLLEIVRQYAHEQLREAGEVAQVRGRHLDFFLRLAEAMEPKLTGADRSVWLQRLAVEHDNLRAALAWSQMDAGDGELGLRLAGALFWFWSGWSVLSEGRSWLQGLLTRAGLAGCTPARAKALYAAGELARFQGDHAIARAQLEESVAIGRVLGDTRGVAEALRGLGLVALAQGDYTTAHALCAESVTLFRVVGDAGQLALSLYCLGDATIVTDPAAARAIYEESLALCRKLGDTRGAAFSLTSLGRLALQQGDVTAAQALFAEGLAIRRALGHTWLIAISLNSLGDVMRCQGDYERAGLLYDEGLALARELGLQSTIAWSLHNLGAVALAQGDAGRAVTYFAESIALERDIGSTPGIARSLAGLAGVAEAQGQPERAARLFGAADALLAAIGASLEPADRRAYERNVATIRAQLDVATFNAAWAAGRAMSLEQAIAEAVANGA